MEGRAKRNILTAFLLSVLAPCSGLLYVHKPVRALVCALILLAVALSVAQLDLLLYWEGLLGVLAVGGGGWVYATLSSILLARKGLPVLEAQHDIGPWVVAYLLLSFVGAWAMHIPAYHGYAVDSEAMAPTLEPGDYVLGRALAGPAHQNFSATIDGLRIGDLIVYQDAMGDGRNYIRRLGAMPGDVLEVRAGRLYRNNVEQQGVALKELPGGTATWVTPSRTVLLLADDPSASWHGKAVPLDNIATRLLYIYWSGDLARLGPLAR